MPLSFKLTHKFLAATVLAMAATVAAPKPTPVIDYEAILNTQKFRSMEAYILEQSIRPQLNSETLRQAARKGIDQFAQNPPKGKEINPENLLTAALKGMFSSLSPHDDYMDPQETREFQSIGSSSFAGLGILLETKDGRIIVKKPVPGSPAEQAGIKKGDIIQEVDGKSLHGLEVDQAVEIMRGEPGSQASIKILRDGAALNMSLTRAIVKQSPVTYKMLEGGVAHFHLKGFSGGSNLYLKHAIARAKADALNDPVLRSRGGLKGAILDFTFDSGGLLPESRQISDDFLDTSGPVVTIQGRADENSDRYAANPGDILRGLPLVVLVNEGSASASEIVPGALQDHDRAVIMGRPTFGKGTVQVFKAYSDGTGSKLTISIFKRPSGASNQWVGVHPDILVDTLNPDYEAFSKQHPSERALPNSITNTRDVNTQKERTKSVCSPVRQGITAADAGTDKGVFVQEDDASQNYRIPPLKIGALNPLLACARDYILQQADPGYVPRFTKTVPIRPALTN